MVFSTSHDIRVALQHRGVNSVGSPSLNSQLRVHWLEALVTRFGADTVAHWQTPPDGWTFSAWRARTRRGAALHRTAAAL